MKRTRVFPLLLAFVLTMSSMPCLSASAVGEPSLASTSSEYVNYLDLEVNLSDVMIADDYLYYVTETSNSEKELTLILSYEENESGLHRVSPSEFLTDSPNNGVLSTGSYPITFPSYTLYVTVHYYRYNGNYSWYIYRPYGVSAYWTSSTITADQTVSVYYGNYGQLCTYPDCLDPSDYYDMVDTIVSSDYNHGITAYSSSLGPNTITRGYSYLSNDRAIWFENSVLHGSHISVSIGSYNDSVDLGVYY